MEEHGCSHELEPMNRNLRKRDLISIFFFGHLLAGKSLKLPNRCCSEMEVARILVKRIHARVEYCVGHETTLTFLHLCWVCLSPKNLVSYDLTFHPSKIMK